jgi:glycosyltransferase involved in cell wall biosynthesis
MSKPLEFSIVIPTYRRPGHLIGLLSSLTHLHYDPEQFEVIVVDDGGDYPLDGAIVEFEDKLVITLLRQENSGSAAARNAGSKLARGKYLAFIDDDCQADPNWLRAMKGSLEKNPRCACGGRVTNALPENPYSAASQLLIDYLYEHYNPLIHFTGFFPAANLIVPREIFLDMGGFDPTMRFGEDRDFCYRWSKLGYLFALVPKAVVYHSHELDLRSLLSLHLSYGGGTYQFWKRHNKGVLKIAKLNPPSWHLNLILSGIRKGRNAKSLRRAFLLFVIQGMCTCGIFWEWAKNRSKT